MRWNFGTTRRKRPFGPRYETGWPIIWSANSRRIPASAVFLTTVTGNCGWSGKSSSPKARLLNITWPREYGGRGGTLTEEIIFHQEHAAAAAPYWVGVHGRDLFGPTLLHFGTDEQKSRFLPAITGVREFWGQGFSEPGAGSDLAGCVPAPYATATSG